MKPQYPSLAPLRSFGSSAHPFTMRWSRPWRIAAALGVLGATLAVASASRTLSPQGNRIATIILLSAVVLAASGAGLVAVRNENRKMRRALRRKQTVQRLNQGLAERLTLVMRHANDAIVLLDQPGRIIEANARALATYGYSLEELRALPPGGLVADATPARSGREAVRSRDGTFEAAHRRKDGTLLPVEGRLSDCEIDGEKLQILVCRDITDRKQLEAAQREIGSFFRTTFESAGVGMALVDMQGHPVQSNPALQHMLGYSNDELTGMVFTEFTHPEDRNRDWRLYQGLIEGQRDRYEMEKRYIRKDGTVIWGALTVSLVRDAEGQPLFTIGALQEVTERKQAEDYRAQVAAIVESSEDAIVGQNLDGVIRSWNGGAEKLFGYKRREAVGQSMAIVFPPGRIEEERIILARVALGETVSHLRSTRRRKGGELIDVSVTISPIRDADGAITGACSWARNITAREPANSET